VLVIICAGRNTADSSAKNQALLKTGSRQKDGGKKISRFHIFALIFLPFSFRLSDPPRSI
jgi:hypothetical protein